MGCSLASGSNHRRARHYALLGMPAFPAIAPLLYGRNEIPRGLLLDRQGEQVMNRRVIDFVLEVTNEGLLITIVVCGPPILLSMIIGLCISLFQAVTQIQEATLTFVPKMVVIFAALAVLGPWLGSVLIRFTRMCFEGFPLVLK